MFCHTGGEVTFLLPLAPFQPVLFAACLHPFIPLITGVTVPLHEAVGEGPLSVGHL